VCQGFTSGSQVVGDSFGDFLDLALSAALTGGGVPAATIAGNAVMMKINDLLDTLGLTKLVDMASKITSLRPKLLQLKKGEIDKKEIVGVLKDVLNVAKAIPPLMNTLNPLVANIEMAGGGMEVIDELIQVLGKVQAAIEGGKSLKHLLTTGKKLISQLKGVPNPAAITTVVEFVNDAKITIESVQTLTA
jgi:hypothetical protein